MYKTTFQYDKKGYGDLLLWRGGRLLDSFRCRTGSIDSAGKLINAIKPGIWTAREPVVITDEIAMVVDGFGFKLRLWTPDGKWSHYLIHPDGNKPGSDGCIVSLSGHRKLYEILKEMMTIMHEMPVEVTI